MGIVVGVGIVAGGMTASAAPLVDDAFFSLETVPAELSGTVRPGSEIDFSIEENMTTGYSWVAVYEPRECRVLLEHKSATDPARCGAPGAAVVEIRPHVMKPCVVQLCYMREFEPNVPPVKKVRCVVTPVQKKAEPSMRSLSRPAEVPARAPLRADTLTMLADLPNVFDVTIVPGMDLDFDLEESPEKGLVWSTGKYDPALCHIRVHHEKAGALCATSRAEIEIRPLKAGKGIVELHYGPEKDKLDRKTLKLDCTFYGPAR